MKRELNGGGKVVPPDSVPKEVIASEKAENGRTT